MSLDSALSKKAMTKITDKKSNLTIGRSIRA